MGPDRRARRGGRGGARAARGLLGGVPRGRPPRAGLASWLVAAETTTDESVGRGTAWALATQLITAAGTGVLTLYLVHKLGPHAFGVFALAISIGGLLVEPGDLGIAISSSRFIAVHLADRKRVMDVLAEGLRLKLIASTFICGALAALAGPIASAYGEPGLAAPVRWIALTVFMQSLLGFYRGAFASLRRQSTGFRIVASESAAETGVSIALVALGTGAAGARAGRAAGYTVGAVVALALCLRLFGRGVLPRRGPHGREVRRQIARYARSLFALDIAFAISAQLSPLLIGAFFGARDVGFFQAPARLIVFFSYPGLSLANTVAPRVARDDDEPAQLQTFELGLRRLILVQGFIVVPVLAWAHPIVRLLLGADFHRSGDVLQGMAPYVFFAGLTPLVTLTYSYLGEAGLRLRISIVSIVLDSVVTLALLPPLGLTGAVLATDIAAAYYVPVHLWFLRRRHGVALRPLLVTGMRTALAVAAGTAV